MTTEKTTAGAWNRRNRLLLSLPQILFADLLDLVFPPSCVGCGRVDYVWCPTCQQALDAVPLDARRRRVSMTQTEPPTNILTTGMHTGKLQQAVQALKYENAQVLCEPLGHRLIALAGHFNLQADAVVPVPLHPKRQQQRGYNQAALLAEYIALRLNLDYLPHSVGRLRDTPQQVGLGRKERLRNVRGAFTADATLVRGKSIWLIDDVTTTGATLAACAAALQQAGVEQVLGMTVTMANVSFDSGKDRLSFKK